MVIRAILILMAIWLGYALSQPEENSSPKQAPSICFILGEDKGDHQYYTLAESYFRTDTNVSCDRMIKHIRSIEALISFLNTQKQNVPYGRIEVVVHGNVWSGLSAKIFEGGERAYPKDLLKASMSGALPKLMNDIVDSNTVINIWGCGIGTNPLLRIGVSNCFRTAEGIEPKVNLSTKFVVFKQMNDAVKMVQASYWPYFFKRGYRPSEQTISTALSQQYPDATVNFEKILKTQSQDVFLNEFHVPIKWVVDYPDKTSRPDVTTKEQQMNWILNQPALVSKIKEFSIPVDQYHWRVEKILQYQEDGSVIPAIKAVGMSTVMCVLNVEC